MGTPDKSLAIDSATIKALSSLRQLSRYRLVLASCLVISIAGVCWGIHVNTAAEAQRGGALATMIAFVNLLVRPDYGRLIYNELKASLQPDQLEERFKALDTAMALTSKGQSRQNAWIASATVVSTLFWGFGDVIASWFHTFPSAR